MISKYKGSFLFLIITFCVFIIGNQTDLNVYNTLKYTTEGLYKKFPVNFNGISIFTILPLILGYYVTFKIGQIASSKLFFDIDTTKKSLFLPLIASFPIGYLIIIGIYRLNSIFIPVSFNLYIFSMFICFFLYNYNNKELLKNKYYIISKKQNFRNIIIFSSLVIILAILSVNMGDFTYVGHGPMQYARKIKDVVLGGQYFPFFASHYDEPIFHHFIAYPLYGSPTATYFDISNIISWWITLSIIKCSTLYYLYFVSRIWRIKKIYAFSIVLFTAFGTIATDPTNYMMLFDSSNPLAFIAHSGRVVPIYLVTLLAHITFIFYYRKVKEPHKNISNMSKFFLFLLGIGVSSTTLSNSMWIFGIIFIFSSIYFFKHRVELLSLTVNIYIKIVLFLAPFPISALLFSNFLKETGWDLRTKFLLVLFSLFLFCLSLLANNNNIYKRVIEEKSNSLMNNLKPIFPLIYVALGTLVGLIFMGNLFSLIISKFIFWDTVKGSFFYAMQNPIWAIPLSLSDQAIFGDFRLLAPFNQFNSSISGYVGYYGILYLFVIGILIFSASIYETKKSQLKLAILERYLLCFYCILPFLYFFIEYTSFGYDTWSKTRFLEVPVYGILIFSSYIFFLSMSDVLKKTLFVILLILSIVPFIANNHITKLIFNYDILISQYYKTIKK